MAHPLNWRKHPQRQRSAVKGSLDSLGWVSVVIENTRTGNLVDGHERIWQAMQNGDAEVPFITVDLSPEEEAQALLSLDAIAALAQTDAGKVDELLRMVDSGNEAVQEFLSNLSMDVGLTKFDPTAEWEGAPEFDQEDKTAFQSIHLHFKNQEDIDAFAELVGQKITPKTRSIWYPEIEIERYADKRYSDES
jgi:hypothetical protein